MNPFYQAMQPKQPMNFWQRFQQFRSEMQGKDPNALIQEMMQSGETAGTTDCKHLSIYAWSC